MEALLLMKVLTRILCEFKNAVNWTTLLLLLDTIPVSFITPCFRPLRHLPFSHVSPRMVTVRLCSCPSAAIYQQEPTNKFGHTVDLLISVWSFLTLYTIALWATTA
jgi:hypothetical protein